MGTRRAPERAPAPNRHPAGSSAEGAAEEELEGPGVRADSRTYLLNVRPENRTTFCAIISQLTEETQPSFEVTLKSRAVSEDCDAKFTCIVSGFPEPELTWYKDDEEMDRYCGLPKYAILRNGKRHTLQLYKCKEEDAAIYQASARNSKGIVSCSGVLEVGTMTEYKIHQRWFAKLKRKAEAKMREIEQSRKRGKENVENKLRTLSPERIQRKRRFSAEDGKKTPASVDKEDVINAHIPDPTSRLQADVDDLVEQQLMNGESEFPNEIMPRPTGGEVTTNGYASPENLGEDGKEFLAYVYETVEITTKRPTAKESSAKKKKKEEEPAAVPLEVKREEKSTTSGIKKGDGPSPVAVRSRFVAVPSKAQAHERMEVDKSAGNRNVVTVSPKIPKLTLARDPKKNKEAGPLKSKEHEGSNPQLCSTPSKGEAYFSLREMYLENTALPAEEKKTPPIPERVRSKIKPDHQGLQIAKEKPPEILKIVPPKSGQEGPKLISRHDQVQKEELAGSEPQLKDTIGLTVMEMDVKSPFVDFKNKELKRQSQVPMPGPEIQLPLPVEKEPVCETTSLPSTSFLNVPDKSFVESDLLNSVLPDAGPLCETVAASINPKARQNVLPPGKDDIKSSVSDAHREQLVFEAPSEVMAREEALQKYQRLEMEYQALQRAYALLQQQLEQTLNTDREVKDVKLNATPFSTETSTFGKVVSNEDSKAPVTEPNKPHPPASESNVSAPEMLESKDPADALKFPVPESTEPKPPARKLKAHAPESTITAPVLKSPALESTETKTIQPVLNTPAPEQSEPIPPARKTKAPPSETKRVAPEQKSATTEPSESKVSALAMKSSLPEPSLTESLTPETKTPLPGPKVPESEMKALATEPTMPAPQPKAFAPKSNKDTKNSVQNVYVADVPVYMETELSGKETSGCIPKPDMFTKQNVDYRAAEQLLDKSKKPFVHSINIPLTVMECASEGKGHFKENDTVEMELRDKDTQAQLALNTEVMGADILQHIDVLKSTLKECVSGYGTETFLEIVEFPAEVEMTEDTKQDQQTSSTWTALSACWVGEHQPCTEIDLSTIEKKSLSTSHEIVGKVSGEVEDASVDVTEIISPCADEGIHPPLTDPLPYLSILSHHHEVPQHKTDLSSTEVPISSSSPPSEESVATLLRDVKKELDTGTPSDMASLTEADNAIVSLQRERVSPNEDYEVEIMLQVPQGEANDDKKQVVLETKGQAIAETVFKVETLPPDSSETKEPMSIAVTVPLVSQGTQEVVSADIFMDQEKQNSGFVASLKNSLLMLLNITKTDTNKGDTKDEVKVDKEGKVDDCTNKSLFPDMGIVGSNPATGAIRETTKNDAYIQKEESLTSSSTSGIMTPVSDDDMVQNVLQLSPTTSRTFAEAIDKELFPNMESPCTSPRTARKTDGVNSKELFSSKEDLHLSPATSRSLTGKVASETESMSSSVPSIVVANVPQTDSVVATDVLPDLQLDENEMGTSEENVSMIPAATPQELALGARRKIYLSKPKQLDDAESNALDSTTVSGNTNRSSPNVSPGLSRRNQTLLQANMASQSPPMERRSPGLARKMATLEVPKIHEESTEVKTSEGTILEEKNYSAEMKEDSMELKKANDPYKAPQVIRKIRAEQFSDASGNVKLWCQFFNILSDSVISWFKDEYPVAEAKRSAGDEGQVALAIVQASKNDCGVYQCTIKNNYGTDSTDFLLSAEVLSGFITREETEVGEEIEMTPMVFAKGLADSGYWGDKFFGRIATEDVNVGKGYLRKVLRVKVIYGLEPLFESGKTCIIKIRNLITFGTKSESTLLEKNYDLTIQGCKIQNTTREYSKIFAAEARVVPNFGQVPEIIPLNLIYRPANNIPYATIEDDLEGQFEKYCTKDKSGNLQMKNTSEIEKKCCAFQHWAYQWTNGNFLITDLQGVGWKITNVAIATKTKGYQGLKESCCPASLDLFTSVHQCNNYCEMLGLRSLKSIDTLQTPTKPKGSKSPSIGRKAGSTQSSPQIPKKGMPSPQGTRKSAISPKTARKSAEAGEPQPSVKHKAVEMPKSVRMR